MGNKRPAIGLDLDGCLAKFSPRYIQMMNEKYGLTAIPDDQVTWDFDCFGINKTQDKEIWNQILNTPNFWMTLETYPNTRDLIEAQNKYRLYFITNRPQTEGMRVEDQCANWIRRHYFIPNPTVIVASEKGGICAALKLDAYLDDNVPNVLDVYNHIQNGVYLQTQPYNKDVSFLREDIRKARSVNDFFKKIGGL